MDRLKDTGKIRLTCFKCHESLKYCECIIGGGPTIESMYFGSADFGRDRTNEAMQFDQE